MIEPVDLPGRVEAFAREQVLWSPGARVLVACSGGPDSTALLDLMRTIAPRFPIELGALHVDHGQHPHATGAMRQVRDRCRRWGIPFYNKNFRGYDLPAGASEARLRWARYRAYRGVATEAGYDRVATGHTECDQAETVLMRILRGTGTAGLAGIPARRADLFVRPLLCCTREEVMAHLRSRRLRASQDPTNTDTRFLRNWIRHDLLPRLRKEVNPAVDQALLRLSAAARRDNDLLGQMASALFPLQADSEQVEIPLATALNLHDSVLARVLVRMLVSVSRPGANLEQAHVERVLDAVRSTDRRRWSLDLPGRIFAGVVDDRLVLGRNPQPAALGFRMTVHGPGDVELPDGETHLRLRIVQEWDPDLATSRHVFFDADRIQFPLTVRSVAPGDRLHLWGGGGTRKVSRILMEARIPRHRRLQVPLLVADAVVLWAAGLRRSSAAPVVPGTRRVLSVQLLRESFLYQVR